MHVLLCASMCEFRGQNYVKGGNVKPRKIRNFQKWKSNINNNKLSEWFKET